MNVLATPLLTLTQAPRYSGQSSERTEVDAVAKPAPTLPPLAWPPMRQVLGPVRSSSLRERIKYRWRIWRAAPYKQALLERLAQQPIWRGPFESDPRYFFAPLSHFLDRRWATQQRFQACLNDLQVSIDKFGLRSAPAIARGQPIVLCTHAAFRLELGLNSVNSQEGFWAVSLHTPDGLKLFNLSFGFLAPDAALIASMQGIQPSQMRPGIPAAIHAMTKASHGLRPHHLLLAVFQTLCSIWEVSSIFGIDPKHHIKGRWNQRRRRLKFDYRALWSEAGGMQLPNGYWALPMQPRRRREDEIPTRKRAAYRRRYVMLEQLAAQIASAGLLPVSKTPC